MINAKVNFMGCKGHYEVTTAPDATGSLGNASLNQVQDKPITITYGLIPRKDLQAYMTQVIYYGQDASNCTVTVDASLGNGVAAKGEEVKSIQNEITKDATESESRKKYFDLAWKLAISLMIIILYSSIRKLKP